MMADVKESGYHSVNPFVFVEDAERLIAFLIEAFGAKETERITLPDGRIGHAEVLLGDSIVMLSEASDAFPARVCAHYVFVDDVDSIYERSVSAGATSLREPTDQFYGNREAGVVDGFGNIWWLATVIEDVPGEELQRRSARSTQS